MSHAACAYKTQNSTGEHIINIYVEQIRMCENSSFCVYEREQQIYIWTVFERFDWGCS